MAIDTPSSSRARYNVAVRRETSPVESESSPQISSPEAYSPGETSPSMFNGSEVLPNLASKVPTGFAEEASLEAKDS